MNFAFKKSLRGILMKLFTLLEHVFPAKLTDENVQPFTWYYLTRVRQIKTWILNINQNGTQRGTGSYRVGSSWARSCAAALYSTVKLIQFRIRQCSILLDESYWETQINWSCLHSRRRSSGARADDGVSRTVTKWALQVLPKRPPLWNGGPWLDDATTIQLPEIWITPMPHCRRWPKAGWGSVCAFSVSVINRSFKLNL